MKSVVFLLAIALSSIVIVSSYLIQGIPQVADDGSMVFVAVTLLFLVPVAVLFIILFLFVAHPQSYHFSQYFFSDAEHEPDAPLLHHAIGFLEFFLQDFSSGVLADPSFYGTPLRTTMVQELEQLRVWRDRGYRIHFAFHHDEPYRAHVVHAEHRHDVVVEIDGLFDFYFERDGLRTSSPHQFDQRAPLERQPARIRVRMIEEATTHRWQLVGLSESIRGSEYGLATA